MIKNTSIFILITLLLLGTFGHGIDLLLCISETGTMSLVPAEHTHHCVQCDGHESHSTPTDGNTGIQHSDSHIHVAIKSALSSIVLPSRSNDELPEQNSDTIGEKHVSSPSMNAGTEILYFRTQNNGFRFNYSLSFSRTVVSLS